MVWFTRYHLRVYIRRSAWLVPTASIPAALIISPLVRRIDDVTGWRGLGYTPDAARSVLNAIVPATLTFLILVLSTLLLTIQLASSQMSPRLIASLLSRRPVKFCLFVFVFSYVYSAGVLGRVDDRVPQLSVAVAIGLTLVSVAAVLFLIDYLAKELRPVQMLSWTAAVGRKIIEQVYPTFVSDNSTPAPSQRPKLPAPSEIIAHTGRSGVLLAMNLHVLIRAAKEAGGAIEIIPEVGDFVARGSPLFRIYPSASAIRPSRLTPALAFGDERTPEQDPAFAFRILVDVASKALSPAINDPTTAVFAIDQIHHLLRQVGVRRLDAGEVRDEDGVLRVFYRTPDWDDFILLAVTEIRQYGIQSMQVVRRLRAMLENLSVIVPPERREVLREQLRLLYSGVERSFNDPQDRACARISDLQGVGGSGKNGAIPQ